jgi:hypothetical protein
MIWVTAGAADAFRALAQRASNPPLIDGRLSELEWQAAPPVTGFLQVEPVTGAAPSIKSDVRLLYDANALYIGLRAFDSRPDRITARQLQRDADLGNDDHLTVVLGPFGNARDGYLFRVNPLGAQQDGLIYDGAELRTDWDGLWSAAGHIDQQGWTAELAIPFAALSYVPRLQSWRLNLERRIARLNERVRWQTPRREVDVTALQVAGELTGLTRLRQGFGLRLRPSLNVTAAHDGRLDAGAEPSLDAFYQLTPAVTASLTLNTDFAETEVDERRVNLTRFPLFFPEKRDFFLQDAGLFEFGGIAESPLPFFSRRIGLDERGVPIDIDGGIKLTGRTEQFDFGVLSTRVAASEDTPATTLSVARAKMNLTRQTSLGVIATDGDPLRYADSRLLGFDARYRAEQFLGRSDIVDLGVWTQTTEAENAGNGSAFGLFIDYPNPGWTGNASFEHIDRDFRPALGFVDETGIRQGGGELGYWNITDAGADIIPQFDWNLRTDTDGGFRASTLNPEVYLENAAGDYFFPELYVEREKLIDDFEILPGLVIPAGNYRYENVYFGFGSSFDRALAFEAFVSCCEFYDGARRDIGLDLFWRPSAHFGLALGAELNDLDLPGGSFLVQTLSLGLDWRPFRAFSLNNIVQYDNVSERIGLNSRLRYNFASGRDLFIVLNHDAGGRASASGRGTQFIIKLAWTFML